MEETVKITRKKKTEDKKTAKKITDIVSGEKQEDKKIRGTISSEKLNKYFVKIIQYGIDNKVTKIHIFIGKNIPLELKPYLKKICNGDTIRSDDKSKLYEYFGTKYIKYILISLKKILLYLFSKTHAKIFFPLFSYKLINFLSQILKDKIFNI